MPSEFAPHEILLRSTFICGGQTKRFCFWVEKIHSLYSHHNIKQRGCRIFIGE